ncbi:DUF1294 domain-containing protein [Flavobacterium chungbukense]|uniref:DUF1294 domain-containing protein n=1 Tax=Flavobacterium chungbukense TaxID=877464 RepID=UPI001E335B58|nr:DUF1294 domain-containing protein [Flavobacterium chungbukense]MCC4922040.1 DUF1294 domain-containing protein [Flavobacterium chungbukense]
MKILLLYFLLLNCFTFLLTGYDKFQARRHKRRIPEFILFVLAFVGGTIGLLTAMLFFRHKTSKITFIMKFSYVIIVQIVVIYLKLNHHI